MREQSLAITTDYIALHSENFKAVSRKIIWAIAENDNHGMVLII